MTYVLLYLAAIITANLLAAWLGPPAVIFNALALIALDLTARDRLHDLWTHQHLTRNMLLLVATGSLLTWLTNPDAGRVALASAVAFTLAAATDTLVYHHLRHKPTLARVNASNLAAATVDSLIFPTLAFGQFLPLTIAGMIAAKTAGAALWSLVLMRPRKEAT